MFLQSNTGMVVPFLHMHAERKLFSENFWVCLLATALLLSSAEKESSLSNVYLDYYFNLPNPTISHSSYFDSLQDLHLPINSG